MENQNIRIRLKAFDHRILDQSTNEIVNTAKRRRQCPWPNSFAYKYETFYRPAVAHIDKKSREQFEMRTHKRLMNILDLRHKL